MDDELLEGQLAYYRARAGEYDEWFLRKGRHDRGPEWNCKWFSELDRVRKELDGFAPVGDLLELACGTGLWAVELARHANAITAVDASPEVLEINRARLHEAHPEVPIHYVQADLFDWHPEASYDTVYFGFWLSHVPPERFEAFWMLVRSALKPGGRVFFVDSLRTETWAEKERLGRDPRDHTTLRQLNDGQEFRIVKIFYDPEELSSRLRDLGWNVHVRTTDNHLLYGFGEPRTESWRIRRE
ncbi:MAG: methyltransferase domain-containing protein [Rubrobacteraceae bacterium]|nr:methyltransferase domain-containing protein [Rubrobacteraceae bacterium]